MKVKLTTEATGWKATGKTDDGKPITYGLTTNRRGREISFVKIQDERERIWARTDSVVPIDRMTGFLKRVLGHDAATPKAAKTTTKRRATSKSKATATGTTMSKAKAAPVPSEAEEAV